MKEVFTLRRFYLYTGLLCSLFFLAMLVFNIVTMFYMDDDCPPRGRLFMALSVLVFSSFLAMSVWLILAYYRESITSTLALCISLVCFSTEPSPPMERTPYGVGDAIRRSS